jgi:hypothetical protein
VILPACLCSKSLPALARLALAAAWQDADKPPFDLDRQSPPWAE